MDTNENNQYDGMNKSNNRGNKDIIGGLKPTQRTLLVILSLVYIPVLITTVIGAYILGATFYSTPIILTKILLSIGALITLFVVNLAYISYLFKITVSIKTKTASVKEINIIEHKKALAITSIVILTLILIPSWIGYELTKASDIKTVDMYK